MIKNISATKAKNNFGNVIDEVYSKGNTINIYRNNKPVAKIVPIYTYELDQEKKPLVLSDKEYEKVKEGMKEFRENFDFTY